MDPSGFGARFNNGLGIMVVLALVGGGFTLAFLGALVGAILTLPFALWQHDFSVMVLPTAIFAAIPPVAAGLYLAVEAGWARFWR